MASGSIRDMESGDFVKGEGQRYYEIDRTYGVSSDGRLAKPSEGGFGVVTKGGRNISMWNAHGYCKKEDLPEGAHVVRENKSL